MPRGRAIVRARTARASTAPASTAPAAVRPTPGSAPWLVLRRLPLLAMTVVVGVTVLGVQLAGATVAASWLAAIFALGVAVYLAVGMIRDVRRGHWGVDILAVTAVVSTVVVGEYLAAMIIVLMLAGGEALENYAGGRARRELTSLLAGAPRVAHLVEPDGDRMRDVPVDTVGVGDRVLVRPSEVVPVDGVLRSPSASFDESSLTGESIPVDRVAGEPVLSGALNGTGAVTITATATAADSEYSQIVSLVRSAAASRAPVVRLADRYAIPFTAAAYLLAAAAWILSGDATRFAAVLVVATPCPLLIAAPVAFLGGMSRAARRGIIVKSAAALEQSARIRTVAFDKTGTLTRGRPTLLSVVPTGTTDPDTVLAFAAAAEQYSSHVLATSVTQAATDRGLTLPPVTDAREWATHGVSATVAGHEVRVGKPGFLAEVANDVAPADLQGGELAVYVGIDRRYAGVLLLADPVRDEAAETVRRLATLGVQHTLMVTGDAETTARKVAELVGITDVRAECLPADKVAIVAAATNRPVLMVGDGVNDAPVLAAADVGVAMGARGATAAAESADIVILPDDLSRVSDAVASGRRTVQVALQSIWIGIGLSLGLMVVAAFGYLPPVSGAVLQEVVDLATIGNALRAMTAGRRTLAVPLDPSRRPQQAGSLLLMRRRNVVIAASATAAAIGLAATLVAVLPGRSAPPSPAPAGSPGLFSPFTGEPVPALGPVRSAREDDLELLRQFGRLAFAYSGAQPQLLPVVEKARTVDLYAGRVGGYFRDPHRVAPHNLYARTPRLLAGAPGASKAQDIGFRFGPAPPGGRATTSFSVSYPAAGFMFRWSAQDGRWLVWMDGAPARATEGGQLSAPTVVIQYTKVRTSRFLEAGVRPPYAESTGAGTGVVLRGGQAYAIRWSRPDADGGTTFTTTSGQAMTFARGPVWVVLAAAP